MQKLIEYVGNSWSCVQSCLSVPKSIFNAWVIFNVGANCFSVWCPNEAEIVIQPSKDHCKNMSPYIGGLHHYVFTCSSRLHNCAFICRLFRFIICKYLDHKWKEKYSFNEKVIQVSLYKECWVKILTFHQSSTNKTNHRSKPCITTNPSTLFYHWIISLIKTSATFIFASSFLGMQNCLPRKFFLSWSSVLWTISWKRRILLFPWL